MFLRKLYNLISNLRSTPYKIPLPFNGDYSSRVFNVHSIIIVSVTKDDVRDPNRTHLVKYTENELRAAHI